MTDIILSIHPEHAENILSGKKTLEIRKSEPKRAVWGDTIYLYETAPISKVVGSCRLMGCMEYSGYDYSGNIANKACISVPDLRFYMAKAKCRKVYLWHIDSPYRFTTPIHISNYGLTRPPQSFCYVKEAV